jgi:RNA polymerase sigma-70 factor (ECF subfamily)
VIDQRNAYSPSSQGLRRLDWAAHVKDPVDRDLVLKAASGCETWFGSRADAEDAAQEVCVRLAGAIRTYRGEAEFSTWLYRVTYSVVVDEMRVRERSSRFDEAGVAVLLEAPAVPSPEVETLNRELWDEVRNLPNQQRDAVLLVYAEDLTHGEAAAIMGRSEKTVSWHLYAARKRLRARLEAVG